MDSKKDMSLHGIVRDNLVKNSSNAYLAPLQETQDNGCLSKDLTYRIPGNFGDRFNSLPTTANSLKKQKSMYKVLTPNIKPLYKFLWAYGNPPG